MVLLDDMDRMALIVRVMDKATLRVEYKHPVPIEFGRIRSIGTDYAAHLYTIPPLDVDDLRL